MNEPLNPEPRVRVQVPPPQFCECSDPGCPVCGGRCRKPSRTVLYRSDMEDETGTPMCNGCADDAMESGLFYTKESRAFKVVDKLIQDDEPTAASVLFDALKPPVKVQVSDWEKRAGRKVEREHTDSNTTADTIASHHHAERKDYYRKLKQAGLANELEPPKKTSMLFKPGPSIEPMKEPPGSLADLKMKATPKPKPKSAFYPSSGGPSTV